MKRRQEVILAILEELENVTPTKLDNGSFLYNDYDVGSNVHKRVKDISEGEFLYCRQLLSDAALIVHYGKAGYRLTWAGHDYLDELRGKK